eukprot:6476241-Amphidinium_carterae.1
MPSQMFHPVQEHVHRLKNCTGRSSRGILNQVAASVEASEYYTYLLDEFMQTSAATLEKGPMVERFMRQLTDMDKSKLKVVDLDVLLEVVKAFPALQLQLRRGSVNELNKLLRANLDGIGCMLEQKDESLSREALDKTSAILSEALVFFPIDGQLNEWMSATADCLNQCGKMEVVKTIFKALDELSEATASNLADFHGKLKQILETMNPMHVTMDMFSEDGKAQVESTFNSVMNVLKDNLKDVIKTPELAGMLTQCLTKLSGWVGKPVMHITCLAVADGLAVINTFQELQKAKSLDVVNDGALLQTAILLHRRVMRWKGNFEQLGEANIHGAVQKLAIEVGCATKEVAAASELLVDRKTAAVHAHLKGLSDIAGGKSGGLDWATGYQGNCFASLSQHAEDSLDKCNAGDLVNKISSLSVSFSAAMVIGVVHTLRVFSEWKEVMGCFDKPMDMTLKESIQTTIAKARVTKCSGVCVAMLKQHSSKDELRSVIQAEVQELRKHGVDEKVSLQPLLLKTMNLALAMRY